MLKKLQKKQMKKNGEEQPSITATPQTIFNQRKKTMLVQTCQPQNLNEPLWYRGIKKEASRGNEKAKGLLSLGFEKLSIMIEEHKRDALIASRLKKLKRLKIIVKREISLMLLKAHRSAAQQRLASKWQSKKQDKKFSGFLEKSPASQNKKISYIDQLKIESRKDNPKYDFVRYLDVDKLEQYFTELAKYKLIELKVQRLLQQSKQEIKDLIKTQINKLK